MDEAKGEETSDRNLTLRVLTVNFAAIHTSSMVNDFYVHGFLNLALTKKKKKKKKLIIIDFCARVLLLGNFPRVHATSQGRSRRSSQV